MEHPCGAESCAITTGVQSRGVPGVSHPAVWSPAQEGRGPVGASPDEGQHDDQRDGECLQGGKAERTGIAEPGEEKALG